MSDIWVARFSRWLEKLFNAKGGPILVDVNPSIQAVIILPNANDSMATAGWNRFAFGTTTAAVAAQFSAIQLRNPAGSNVMAVIERCTYTNAAADSAVLILKAGAADFATPVVAQRADPRGQLLPTMVATKGSAAAQTGGVVQLLGTAVSFPNAEFVISIPGEIVLAPGDAATIWDNTVNTAFNGTFLWRERPLESSEFN